MYKNKKISLVIPCHNEERLILPTLEKIPDFIDIVFVVDDLSTDNTIEIIKKRAEIDSRINLLIHEKNKGVGSGIINGYNESLNNDIDISVVIGGDDQMPQNEMQILLDPIIDGKADYTKGNRFLIEGRVFEKMPKIRQLGNAVISFLTKIASGYYSIYDVVDGYTAINKKAMCTVNWSKAWKGYGYPMDFLIRLNAYGMKVLDVPRTAIYLEGERQSQIKGVSYALKVSPMLIRGFVWRLIKKYLLRDFHPLFLLYMSGIFFLFCGLSLGSLVVFWRYSHLGKATIERALLSSLLIIVGLQSVFFAMLFEIQQEKK